MGTARATPVMVELRRVLARRRWLYWAAVAVCAAAAALLVHQQTRRVDAAAAAWGETRAVVVADADIAAGAPLYGHVRVIAVPVPLVPAGALGAEALPDELVVSRQLIAAGEIVVAHDVAAGAAPTSLIPSGWAAVPIAEAVPSGAAVGTRVVVASEGTVLTDDAVVVGVGEATLVAVPRSAVAGVAAAAATHTAVVVIAGPSATAGSGSSLPAPP